MNVRQVERADAANLAKIMVDVESHSEFMLFEKGERQVTKEGMSKRIATTQEQGSAIFIAESNGQLIGYLFALRDQVKRTRHRAYLVCGIQHHWRGKGVGTALFKALDDWVLEADIHRLELTVAVKNNAGVALYKKAGFQIEGIKQDSLFINGEYVDEYNMAKIF